MVGWLIESERVSEWLRVSEWVKEIKRQERNGRAASRFLKVPRRLEKKKNKELNASSDPS